MKQIETEIIIEAPIEVVWKTFIAFDAYKEWNHVIDIKGTPELGEKLTVKIILNDKTSTFKPKITKLEEERIIEWTGNLAHRRIFSGNHYFHFHPEGESLTRLTHGERFSGIFSRPIIRKIEKDTIAAFQKFNQAFKEQSECLVI
ncbi:SRPBCC domain-containing protein [Reichenbachiella ulvae]|uniref:SRPBCC domain-containing protein n=1 Tax=Reichenbachiella ulvae TaxID=2980104 RepID=A0ABT3CW65_9BACT|nr:SRPBCC domain-containing protein [Reichenbachiella ulvae]MCV9387811.1 SRPBCC domain-containing protein [Reichenbachiella ulvae]